MLPTGPEPQKSFAYGFFELAAAAEPRPKTVAIVAADAEFAQNAADGARQSIKQIGGFQTVLDQKYPPTTTDFAPIMHAVAGAQSRTSSTLRPIRRTRSASCAPLMKSGSPRKCSAAR